MSEVFMKLIQI